MSDTVDPREVRAICSVCADRHGATWPEGHLATFWVSRCGLCGKEKNVTSPSDYLWPKLGKTMLNLEEVD